MLFANRNRALTRAYRRSPNRCRLRDRPARNIAHHAIITLPPLSLWIEASDINQAAGDLETWPSKIGVPPTQPTGSKRPNYGPTLWPHGGQAVEFDNVGEALACASLDLSGTDKCTVVAAFSRPTLGTIGSLFLYGGQYSWNGDTASFGIHPTDRGWWVCGRAAGSDQNQNGPPGVNAAPIALATVYDRSLLGSDQIATYGPDGFAVPIVLITADVTGNFGAAGQCWIGAEDAGNATPFDGILRELLVFASALTAAQAQAAQRAVAWRGRSL